MALQNIGAANRDDAFYRYKMPRMVTKIEGRGNGIKTNVVNMVDIAKALGRPASYTTKYFGNELGAQSKFDEKTGISLVNGAHETAKLAGLLENFIKKYVQCYGCGNPETEIVITKSQLIALKCAACGFVSDVDARDKLSTFILKNPPEQKKAKDKKALRKAEKERIKEGEAADEEQRKLKKEALKKKGATAPSKGKTSKKKSNGSDEDHSPDHAVEESLEAATDDEVEWQADTSIEAAQQRIHEQLNAVTADMVVLSTIAEKPEEENGVKDVNQLLVIEIKEFLKKGSPNHLRAFMASLSGTPQDIMNALFLALFAGAEKRLAKEVARRKDYLSAATKGGSQMNLLHAIESFCETASSDAMKQAPLVLKALYDADVLEEDVILEWYNKGLADGNSNAPIWKSAKPFIEWLQNAESESDD